MARPGGAERRAQFIASAQQLFFTQGYENTSINDIIDAVGVSKGAFYHHFDSKQAVLEAVIDRIVEQTQVSIAPVMADQTLDALERYKALVHVINDWRLERKAAMIAVLRTLQRPENLRLLHHIRAGGAGILIPAMAQIIAQGIEEGIFYTEWVQESAELAVGIYHASQTAYTDLLLNPQNYDDPVGEASKKLAAAQAATERMLGAPVGSLQVIDPATIVAWFGKP